jgi:protein TonB
VIGSIAATRHRVRAPALLAGLVVAALLLVPARAAPPAPSGSKAMPVAVSTPAPDFPEGARRSHKSGYVVVAYTVGVDGSVGNVRIVESSPRGVFDHAVESALARWRFQPLPAPREVTHTFYFDE